MAWHQVYRDSDSKWEKIHSCKPPTGLDIVYSLRITQAKRATAYRDDVFIHLLTITANHDDAYDKKH